MTNHPKPNRYAGLDNRDLRLRNITDQDRAFYNHKVFIVTLQRAKSVEAAAKKLHLSVRSVVRKASYLRKRGIPLRLFINRQFLDSDRIKKLVALAKRHSSAPDLETFIKTWNSEGIAAVAKTFNITHRQASFRASQLRNGFNIPLRRFRIERH